MNGWAFYMRSRSVFMERADALQATANFIDACCDDDKYFEACTRDTIKVVIQELELC